MKKLSLIFILITTMLTAGGVTTLTSSSKINNDGLTVSAIADDGDEKARSLVGVINQYRRDKGLAEIPYSPWLTYVARWHVYDLENNRPDTGSCNMHSWSDKAGVANYSTNNRVTWSACCYTGNHTKARCMWDKPREISKGAYKANGFEIACRGNDIAEMTNYRALECWKESQSHLDVMLNRGKWNDNKWKAIGAAISYHYAVVWFAEETDASN